jgi:hypothetical protein
MKTWSQHGRAVYMRSTTPRTANGRAPTAIFDIVQKTHVRVLQEMHIYTKSPPSLTIAPILSDFFMRFREWVGTPFV